MVRRYAVELPVGSRLAIIGAADGALAPVEREMFGRGARRGGRLSGGVRFPSAAGAVDLYAGWEQRIDAGQEPAPVAAGHGLRLCP